VTFWRGGRAAIPAPSQADNLFFAACRAVAVGVLGLFGISNARFIDGMAVDHPVLRPPAVVAGHGGFIEISELVKYVQKVVPGIAKGLARVVTQSEPVFGVQTPRFGSIGGDFALVKKLP
jgi:hypothetical protein